MIIPTADSSNQVHISLITACLTRSSSATYTMEEVEGDVLHPPLLLSAPYGIRRGVMFEGRGTTCVGTKALLQESGSSG